MSGSVLVNDRPITKAGTLIKITDQVRIRTRIKEYVSRGAYKLLGAFDCFRDLNVQDIVCFDLGASTGGFSQVLLEKGAFHVYAVDVGYGLLAQKIANDKRVTVLDRTHVKDLNLKDMENLTRKIFFSMDLSFISLTQIFPYISNLAKDNPTKDFFGISLIKPQFELPSSALEKGIVRNRVHQLTAIRNVWRTIKKTNARFVFEGLAESPIQGADGNHEFLLKWRMNAK